MSRLKGSATRAREVVIEIRSRGLAGFATGSGERASQLNPYSVGQTQEREPIDGAV